MSNRDYDTCKGVCEKVTYTNLYRNINRIKKLEKIQCVRAKECFLFKRDNGRKILIPTETMVKGECSHFTAKPKNLDVERFNKYITNNENV